MDIGFMRSIFFEAEVLFEDIGFTELCDMISSDALDMAEAVTDRQGKINPSICQPEHNMMYIREIFIEEPCRGYGMGEYLLDNFVPLLSHALNLRPHTCVVLPYPQEKTWGVGLSDAAKNAGTNLPRLIAFYEKAGYIKLNGGEYMYKKYTDSLDELFEMLKG